MYYDFKKMLFALFLSKNTKSNKVNNLLLNKYLRGSHKDDL